MAKRFRLIPAYYDIVSPGASMQPRRGTPLATFDTLEEAMVARSGLLMKEEDKSEPGFKNISIEELVEGED